MLTLMWWALTLTQSIAYTAAFWVCLLVGKVRSNVNRLNANQTCDTVNSDDTGEQTHPYYTDHKTLRNEGELIRALSVAGEHGYNLSIQTKPEQIPEIMAGIAAFCHGEQNGFDVVDMSAPFTVLSDDEILDTLNQLQTNQRYDWLLDLLPQDMHPFLNDVSTMKRPTHFNHTGEEYAVLRLLGLIEHREMTEPQRNYIVVLNFDADRLPQWGHDALIELMKSNRFCGDGLVFFDDTFSMYTDSLHYDSE